MQALDFVLYCVGASTFMVTSVVSVRILVETGKRPPPKVAKSMPVEQADDHLASRLRDFQTARYASPIVQRKFDAETASKLRSPVTGLPRPAIRPVPRVVPPPARHLPVPQRTRDDNAIAIPLKQKKNEEPPKEGT